MSKHTPAPWEIEPINITETRKINKFDEYKVIKGMKSYKKEIMQVISGVNSGDWTNEDKANANLIAAAPDLLNAAQKAYDKLIKLQNLLAEEGYESFNKGMNFSETVDLKKAIKKAKGETK